MTVKVFPPAVVTVLLRFNVAPEATEALPFRLNPPAMVILNVP